MLPPAPQVTYLQSIFSSLLQFPSEGWNSRDSASLSFTSYSWPKHLEWVVAEFSVTLEALLLPKIKTPSFKRLPNQGAATFHPEGGAERRACAGLSRRMTVTHAGGRGTAVLQLPRTLA